MLKILAGALAVAASVAPAHVSAADTAASAAPVGTAATSGLHSRQGIDTDAAVRAPREKATVQTAHESLTQLLATAVSAATTSPPPVPGMPPRAGKQQTAPGQPPAGKTQQAPSAGATLGAAIFNAIQNEDKSPLTGQRRL